MARRARRKPFRRLSTRRAWLELLEEEQPELAAELAELRRYNPHAFRKRILLLARERGLAPRSTLPAGASPVATEPPAAAAADGTPSEGAPTAEAPADGPRADRASDEPSPPPKDRRRKKTG